MAQKKLHRKGERHIFVWTVSEHDHTLLGLFFFFLFFYSFPYRITTRPGGAFLQKKIKWIAAAAADLLLHSLLLLQQPNFFYFLLIAFSREFLFCFYSLHSLEVRGKNWAVSEIGRKIGWKRNFQKITLTREFLQPGECTHIKKSHSNKKNSVWLNDKKLSIFLLFYWKA